MPATQANERDQRHLERTVDLASEARGQTGPNPLVGAVVVKSGRVIGEGFHAAAGEPHAERVALGACTEDPAGATMYVSLEPCAHTGRTPPCTEAILEAGIKRVVVASDDPTSKVSGRGLGVLRDEGIEVETVNGEVARAARLINQPFRKHARTGLPPRGAQARDDARRQGGHPHRRLALDLRRGQPRAGAPLADGVRRGGRGPGYRPRRRPAAHRPRGRTPRQPISRCA